MSKAIQGSSSSHKAIHNSSYMAILDQTYAAVMIPGDTAFEDIKAAAFRKASHCEAWVIEIFQRTSDRDLKRIFVAMRDDATAEWKEKYEAPV